ncbi:MAG: hypothetical protein E6719_01800, partial [Dermabacter sp.]|nr:hypothetical protein [Dermabacter sp.]
GVDIFFVISGYLITGIISAEIVSGQFSFARFYERLGDHAVSIARRVVFLVTGDALDSHNPHTDVDEF